MILQVTIVILGLQCLRYVTGESTNASLGHIANRTRLYNTILNEYEENVRPAVNKLNPVTVGFGLSLLRLVDLNEQMEELVLDVMLRKMWEDPRLVWDPEEFDGIEHIKVPVKRLWKPDIVLYNNAGEDYTLTYDPYATVYHTGVVNWVPKALLRSHCTMDMTYFPFDSQNCSLIFASWVYTDQDLNLTYNPTIEESVNIENYRFSKEWDLVAHSYFIRHTTYPEFDIYISFKRNPTFYAHMYLLPAIVFAFLSPCVFLLPPDSKEKITLGGVILLALTICMSSLDEILPREQYTIPTIALYETITMTLVALSLVLCVAINNLHNRGPRKKKVPNFIRQVFLHGLKRVACFGEDNYYPLDEMEAISMRGLDRHITEAESNLKPTESTPNTKMEKDVEQILKHMRGVAIRSSVSEARADIRNEWQLVAMVIDRLLFALYVLMILIITIGVFA